MISTAIESLMVVVVAGVLTLWNAAPALATGANDVLRGASDAPAASRPVVLAAASPSPRRAFIDECGACHMPFPPRFLPARSWRAIMSGLTNHFHEDASLDAETTSAIAGFLVANAADSGGTSAGVLRGLSADHVPIRITDLPWWRREHRQIPVRAFSRADVKTRSNCLACHRRGHDDDD